MKKIAVSLIISDILCKLSWILIQYQLIMIFKWNRIVWYKKNALMKTGLARMDGGNVIITNAQIVPGFVTMRLIVPTRVMKRIAVSETFFFRFCLFKLVLIYSHWIFCVFIPIDFFFNLVHLGKFLDEEPRHICNCYSCNKDGCVKTTGTDCEMDPMCGTKLKYYLILDYFL